MVRTLCRFFVLNLTHVSINVIIPSLVSEMVDELEEEVMLNSVYNFGGY